jgi:nucleoside-diphosphate-sugar epimerase
MSYRVLVTGSSGFIGSVLVPALSTMGHQVRAAARHHATRQDDKVERVVLPDIAAPIDWDPLVAGTDIVVHLAGIAHRQGGEAVNYDQANRGAAVDLAQACLRHPVQRLIFLSSIGAQAGSAADHVLTETDDPRPVTGYDRAKLAAEAAIRACSVPHSILRPVIVYGPNPKANMALLMRIAALPVPLPFGALTNRRSLVSVDNLVGAVVACFDSPATLNETFIVADPAPMTLAEMFRVLRAALGRPDRLLPVPPALIRAAILLSGRGALWDRIGRDMVADSSKLQRAGWQPAIATEQGLRAMVQASSR